MYHKLMEHQEVKSALLKFEEVKDVSYDAKKFDENKIKAGYHYKGIKKVE